MSTIIQPSPSTWGLASFGRMSSVEELDSSLTLLSRHAVLGKGLPMTPPGTPLVARSPEQTNRFDYSPDSPSVRIPPNTPITPSCAKPPQLPAHYDIRCVPRGKAICENIRSLLIYNNELVFSSSTTNGANVPTPNVAAIDNKIEQAMVNFVASDFSSNLLMPHIVLRQTITDLEQRLICSDDNNVFPLFVLLDGCVSSVCIAFLLKIPKK
uniref:Uncharacterized protein n=1 Tax=Heterorhabditis bacteriophora TaxID=37862 RepID=A0A1I7WM48_HETBA